MNNPHLIDNACFDTKYSGMDLAFDDRSEFDNFVKNKLLNVIDEVFDKIDLDCGNVDSVFRIEKLEIDLGNIPYTDYRQQMPGKLREQLLMALREVRHAAAKRPLTGSRLVEFKIDAQAQLFYFLHHGYLPWYSRFTDADALEPLLIQLIDSEPATLIEFLRDNAQPARVLERLAKQFSSSAVQRVMSLASLSGFPENDQPAKVARLEAQLVSALLAGDAALTESAWQALYHGHSQSLKKLLRHYGQQASVRLNIVLGFSPARFNELLQLLEPDAHAFVQTILDYEEVFQPVDGQASDSGSPQSTELRTFTLQYLLVERGGRFSKKAYLRSLLRQMPISRYRTQPLLLAGLIENTGSTNESNTLAGDVLQLLGEVAVEMAGHMASNKGSRLNHETDQSTTGTDSPSIARMVSKRESSSTELRAELAGHKESLSGETEYQAGPHGRYERVLSALTTAGSGRASRDSLLLEDIKILTRDAPYYLARLFRELQAGKYPWRRAIDTLSTPVLAELGHAFIALNKQSDTANRPDPGSDLLSAIHSNAEQSLDKQAFYIHILVCLIRGEPIDFNAIRSDPSFGVKALATPGGPVHPVDKVEHPFDNTPGLVAHAVVDAGEPSEGHSEEPAPLENIYIANAGAVLFAPYLPRLFERLGLVDRGKFNNREAAEYGVHCVQFLVNESTSSPEYQLVLNKLLCGVKPGLPIRRSIELADGHKEQLEALLQAIIQHWKPLANTSIAGLRESFLQRNGSLQLKDEAWHLSVEARSFDMLLDQVPWSFLTIKYPWMDRVIHVEWC